MNSRAAIADYILNLEKEFPVNDWKHNGVHLWPYLRIRLFLELIRQIESDKTENHNPAPEHQRPVSAPATGSVLQKIVSVFEALAWAMTPAKRKILFVGADSHRVEKNGTQYNRYFDTLADEQGLENTYWFLEYSDKVQDNVYRPDHVIDLNKCFLRFLALENFKNKFFNKKIQAEASLKGYDHFIKKLGGNPYLKEFCIKHSEARLRTGYFIRWNNYYRFYERLLAKTKPERLFVLCYYDQTVMPLVAAANKKGIPVIEMQHGPQADLHLAYGSWKTIPAGGYEEMPRVFWCWDRESKSTIDKWAAGIPGIRAIVGGNPWVEYWKKRNEKYPHSDFILYSLQPSPLSIRQLFPPALIEFIRQEKYAWFLRLHPRQLDKKNEIREYLSANRVLELVNIDSATTDPLPQLLAACSLHATHFSGTAIEADLFNRHTVFLNPLSKAYYPGLYSRKQATFVDPHSESFRDELLVVLNTCSTCAP